MSWGAYAAEILEEEEWKYVWIVVGPIGDAVQDVLGAMNPELRDECRVRRITNVEEFKDYAPAIMELGNFHLQETYDGEHVEFENGSVTLNSYNGD